MQNISEPVPGNQQVIDGLLQAVERARNGMARCAAIIFCEHGGADVMYLGDVNARPQVVYGCTLLNQILVSSTSMNVRPMEETRSASLVKYDLSGDPICFDFLPWLVSAEIRRRIEGAPAPLKVAFVRHPTSLTSITDQKWKFLNNVMRPMLELFGAVESGDAANGRHEEFLGLKPISEAYLSGVPVPQMQVPAEAMTRMADALNGRKPVTITLRESGAFAHRNSDLGEWDKFATWLSRQGEDVVIVRDTAKATELFGNFDICPEASVDLHMRAALYKQAKCNCFVTNGPWGLAYFTEVPWLMLASIDDSQPEAFNRPKWWQDFMGLNGDRQLPWASPQQRIVYDKDSFEVMKKAWLDLKLDPAPRPARKGNGKTEDSHGTRPSL